MVASTVPSGTGKKDNKKKKICKREVKPPWQVQQYGDRLGTGLQMKSPCTMSFLSARQELRIMDAKDARETQHPSHHLLPHTTFSCATWSVAYIQASWWNNDSYHQNSWSCLLSSAEFVYSISIKR
jgi:hypothetical protein